MKCSRVIPIGEKLRMLREKYNLNQDEIVGTAVTRNLISQIENGKANLTKNTAEIIVSNVKEILKKNNMILDIGIEYLLEDEESQARKILDEFIEKLRMLMKNKDTSFISTLEDAEKFILRWDFIDEKIIIYDLAGDYFYNNNNFSKASVYYEIVKRLINVNMYMIPLIPVLIKLSKTYFYMGKYQEGIDVCNYAMDRFQEMDSYSKTIFLFNICLYFNYLKDYEKALEFIDKLEPIMDTKIKDISLKTLLLKASCFYHLNRYDEAIQTYENLLTHTPDYDYGNRAIYYNNLSEIYMDMNVLDTSNKYLSMALKSIPNISNDFNMLPQMHLDIAKRYIKLKNITNAITYLKKSLNLAKSFNYTFVINDVLMETVHIPKEEIDIDIKEEFKQLVFNSGIVSNILLVNILQYFSTFNDTKAVTEICAYCGDYLKNN
ncbi:tetratricopeptide repeat protein [Clostridium sp. 19966]|uniref:helix-turn-helix domain-containing protein n=1 Tax=Clostridium sp. 19966 TaxID=2768166 RepID=UPI0028DD7466|nr:tetratricopeptide repeat protein [Clostridium sp. 19966]MDT8717153.1 tetratricopeptide repeat protein [Clostridium sp. 19966]